MSKLIPLPRVEELPEVVLFHRQHPSDQRLLLHVPTGPDGGETYIILLDQEAPPPGHYDPRTDHKGWVKRLPNSQALLDRLSYDMHVSYYPHKGGTVMSLEDPDEIPWVQQALSLAHQSGGGTNNSPLEKRLRERNIRARRPAVASPLRAALGRRPGGSAW